MQHLLQAVEDHLSSAAIQHGEPIHSLNHAVPDGIYTHPAQTPLQGPGIFMRAARDSAEKSVASATRAIDRAGGHGHRIPDNLDPRNVLVLADQFIQTGQYLNYLRAGELGRVVASWYDGPVAVPAGSPKKQNPHLRFGGVLKAIWRRAPLFCLLVGWLLPGLFLRLLNMPAYRTESAFNIWGLGFLALVLFQFVATVRTAGRSKSSRAGALDNGASDG
jgi:hypothetical protein